MCASLRSRLSGAIAKRRRAREHDLYAGGAAHGESHHSTSADPARSAHGQLKMNLAEAFALYGAEGPRRAQRLSAVARDGAIILSCSARRFSRPAAGVLRYE